MATTEIQQFAGDNDANVLTQAEYAALTTILANGFPAGILPSAYLNKVLRQTAFISAGIASWIVSRNINVPDDGDLAALVTKIQAALDDAIGAGTVPSSRTIGTTTPLQGGGDLSGNRTLSILPATTSQAGAVQLLDSVASSSTTEAATANSAKAAYDRGSLGVTNAATAQATANAALPKDGSAAMTAGLAIADAANDAWVAIDALLAKSAHIAFKAGGVVRWIFAREAASANLALGRYDGSEVFQDNPISINSTTGAVTINGVGVSALNTTVQGIGVDSSDITLPGGAILKSGSVTTDGSGVANVVFASPFPADIINTQACVHAAGAYIAVVSAQSVGGISLESYDAAGAAAGGRNVHWFCIGS
jgi:hypothetical protein